MGINMSPGGGSTRGSGPSLSGGGASVGSGYASAIGAYLSARETNEANKQMAKDQMAFQARMSNSSHQREVADLQAAGLNPILSANAGASTPQGATAQMESAGGAAISSAMQAIQLKKQLEETDSRIGLQNAQTNGAAANALKDTASAKGINLSNKLLEKTMPAKTSEQNMRGKISNAIDSGIDSVNSGVKAMMEPAAIGYEKLKTNWNTPTNQKPNSWSKP